MTDEASGLTWMKSVSGKGMNWQEALKYSEELELHMTTPGAGPPQDYQKLESPNFVRDLSTSETTIAEALKARGYATAHFGKWHLRQGNPGQHGFDFHDGGTGNDGADACAADNLVRTE